MDTTGHFPMGMRVRSAILAYFEYVERALWPQDLMVLYPLQREAGSRLLASGIGLVACTLIAIRSLPSRPWLFVGWFWFVGLLFPSIGLVQVGAQATADRYTYLSLAGLSIIAAWTIRDLLMWLGPARRRVAAGSLAVGAVVVFSLLIGAARDQVAIW
jgi:hypothetical protein